MYQEKMTPSEMRNWAVKAAPGDTAVYAIASNVCPDSGRQNAAESAYQCYKDGDVLLFQKCLADGIFEYRMVKTTENLIRHEQRIRSGRYD